MSTPVTRPLKSLDPAEIGGRDRGGRTIFDAGDFLAGRVKHSINGIDLLQRENLTGSGILSRIEIPVDDQTVNRRYDCSLSDLDADLIRLSERDFLLRRRLLHRRGLQSLS